MAKISPFSLSAAKTGHKYDFRVKIPSLIDDYFEFGGRIGVFNDVAVPGIETIYIAVSYIIDDELYNDYDVSLMQITFNNDETECD